MQKLLVIAGAAKAGTSSLAAWLGAMPGFRLGIEKEPRYFSDLADSEWVGPGGNAFSASLIRDRDSYLENFCNLQDGEWAIDASTDYLWCPSSPELIAAEMDRLDIRVVVMVRDPIARAVSEHHHVRRLGWESCQFGDALDAEDERRRSFWHPLFYHRRRSEIARDLGRYHELFGARLKVVDFVQLKRPEGVLREICDFLGTPYTAVDTHDPRNVSLAPRSHALERIRQSRGFKMISRTFLTDAARNRLWRASLIAADKSSDAVGSDEKAKLRAMLSDEIERCLASPLIPTGNWREALAG